MGPNSTFANLLTEAERKFPLEKFPNTLIKILIDIYSEILATAWFNRISTFPGLCF